MLHFYKSIVLAFFCISFYAYSQCIVPPAFPGCAPVGSVALVNGASVNVGQTHTFSGTGTLGGLTLNGGTLVVCGNLTLNALTVNSGNIFVQTGATLTVFNGGAAIPFGANTNIYNYGNIVFRVSVVTGSNNTLINCLTSSSFTVPFDQFVLQGPNTFFVNNGFMQSSFFIVQSTNAPNCICLGNGSVIVTNTIINQFPNAFNVPLGNACLNVTQNVINPNVVTSYSSLLVCLSTGTSIISGPNWGSATVTPNCSSCSVPLPVELLVFNGYNEGRKNHLYWSTATETNNCYFILQRSVDCILFTNIDTLAGAVNSNVVLNYGSLDEEVSTNQIYYYRLKQTDCNGNYHFSNIISLQWLLNSDSDWLIWPNPTNSLVHIEGPEEIASTYLFDALGKEIYSFQTNGTLDLMGIRTGVYYLRIVSKSGEQVIRKLIKE